MNNPTPAPAPPAGREPVKPAPGPADRAVVILTLLAFAVCCGGWLWLGLASEQAGWDFPGFYIAGNVPLESLYDRAVSYDYGTRQLGPLGVDYYPGYVRPAVFSLLLRAVTWLPFWEAFTVWAAIQFIAYLLAIYLMWRRFRFPIELMVGFGLFYPAMMGIITGQDSAGLALLLTVGLLLLLADKPLAAGLVLALCLYKFNLVVLLPAMLLVKKEFRALGWLCAGGAALAAASALLSPVDQYLDLLRNIPKFTVQYEPARTMIGLRSLSYAAGLPALYYPLAAVAAGFTVWAARRLPLARGVLRGARRLDAVRLPCRLVRWRLPAHPHRRSHGRSLPRRHDSFDVVAFPVSLVALLACDHFTAHPQLLACLELALLKNPLRNGLTRSGGARFSIRQAKTLSAKQRVGARHGPGGSTQS